MDYDFSFSEKQLINKIMRFCAYRDRSIWEVKQKMKSLGVMAEKYPIFISYLMKEKFLDEERFCKIYVRSKILQNNWGRQKIYAGLKSKYVDIQMIEEALNSLDVEEYMDILKNVLLKKSKELASKEPNNRKQKLIRYALSKGFTYDEIMQQLNNQL